MMDHGWKRAMGEGMTLCTKNITLSLKKKVDGCQWVYAIKFLSNKQVESLKLRLKVIRYAHTYGVDYFEIL